MSRRPRKKQSAKTTPHYASEELYQALFEQAADGIFIADAQGRFIEVNHCGCEMLGYTREEMLNLSITDLLPPKDLAADPLRLDDLRAGKTVLKERQLRGKDGRLLPVEINARMLLDGTLLGMVRDITERKQAEDKLRQTTEELQQIIASISDCLWSAEVDEEGNWTYHYYSPVVEKITGRPPAFYQNKPQRWLNTIHPDDRPRLFDTFQRILSGQSEREEEEYRIIRPDGTICWVRDRAVVMPLETRRRIYRVISDITERKQIEQALLIQEQKYRTLVENIPNLIVRYNTNLHRTYVNPAWEKASGLSATDVIDVAPADIPKVPQPIVDEYINKLHRVLKTGTPQSSEFSWINARGVTLFLNYIMVPEYGQNGDIIGVLAVGHDITERKRAEEEIRRFNQYLEQRVFERTAQLEASNKELEAFAYSVSHDLRAPLRHINGFLELLQESLAAPLDERSRHYMDSTSNAATRMGQLIDDLLSFSRMGRNELLKTSVDLAAVMQEVIRELAPETKDRSIRWRIADLPTVTGDRAMLRLALTNLISNALKFTRERTPADIEIGCQVSQKETTIFIRDNGVGFDMAYADKLFGVFQRLHRPDEFEGTGIGLANVRRIITRHGGRTWAEGEVDQGATFYFSLPHAIQEIK